MTPRIYTKTGDDGRTGLFGGGRVNKDHVRVEAYGDVDELNAVIGSARSVEMMPRIDEILAPVQRDLLAIGALLATPHPEKHREALEKARLSDRRIAQLEQAIDDGEAELDALKAFILPGGTPKAAALHVARTVCRRAERAIVRLQHESDVPQIVIVYLNRLSDLLFVLARVANRRAGAGEVTWERVRDADAPRRDERARAGGARFARCARRRAARRAAGRNHRRPPRRRPLRRPRDRHLRER